MKVSGNRIAVAPFPKYSTETETKSAFTIIKKKTLVPLEIVYGNDEFSVGGTVWVEQDIAKHPTSQIKYEIEDGKMFILLDEKVVILYKSRE